MLAVIVVLVVVLGILLLRRVVGLALRLAVIVCITGLGGWSWLHRAEIASLAEPYLVDVKDRLGEVDLPSFRR